MTVQPVPAPDSTNELDRRRINDGGNNQKLILFNRGNAISTAPINKGTKKLPKPPTIPGMHFKCRTISLSLSIYVKNHYFFHIIRIFCV